MQFINEEIDFSENNANHVKLPQLKKDNELSKTEQINSTPLLLMLWGETLQNKSVSNRERERERVCESTEFPEPKLQKLTS